MPQLSVSSNECLINKMFFVGHHEGEIRVRERGEKGEGEREREGG